MSKINEKDYFSYKGIGYTIEVLSSDVPMAKNDKVGEIYAEIKILDPKGVVVENLVMDKSLTEKEIKDTIQHIKDYPSNFIKE